MVEVTSRAHRILKPIRSYVDLSLKMEWPKEIFKPDISDDIGNLIGIYINDGHEDGIVIIAGNGVQVSTKMKSTYVLYEDIERLIPVGDGKNVTSLEIKKKSGGGLILPIKGVHEGKFYDSFEVMRFIIRVCSDVGNAIPNAK